MLTSYAVALVMLLSLMWNTALTLDPQFESSPAVVDAYTSQLFLDHLASVMALRR